MTMVQAAMMNHDEYIFSCSSPVHIQDVGSSFSLFILR